MEVDFTDGSFSLKDCFVKYDLPHSLSVKAGNFKESFAMSAMTSSGDLMFMEKASVVSAFAPEYHMGVQGEWRSGSFMTAAGVYFRRINGSKEKDYSETIIKQARTKAYHIRRVPYGCPFPRTRPEDFIWAGHSRIAPRKQQWVH
jgi:phosphate-selective porin